MATVKTLSLDGTNAVVVTTANSGLDGVTTSGFVFDTSTKAEGTASIKAVVTTAGGEAAAVITHATVATMYYDICFRLSAIPAGVSFPIWAIKSGGTNRARLIITDDSKLAMNNGTALVGTKSTATIAINTWYRVQWGITASTQSYRLWTGTLFGVAATETPASAAMTGGTWDRIRFGCLVGQNLTVWNDIARLDDATWPSNSLSSNVPPVANAGSDQSVASAAAVTLSGSGSTDSDGTVTGHTWRQISGPSVILSGTGTGSRTFTAPTLATAADLVFGLIVTDNIGDTSPEDTVTIHVAAQVVTPTDDFVALFEEGTTGSAVTTTSGFNPIDSGWLYTGTGIGEGLHSIKATGATAITVGTSVFAGGATSSSYCDAVYVVDSLPASGQQFYIIQARSGSTSRADVRVNANGTLECRGTSSATVSSPGTITTNVVTPGVPFRVAWHPVNGGTQTLRLFLGSNMWGTTATEEKVSTTNLSTGTYDRFRFGFTAAPSAAASVTLDSVRINGTTWPAPLAATVVSNLQTATDTAWVPERVLIGVGTSWGV